MTPVQVKFYSYIISYQKITYCMDESLNIFSETLHLLNHFRINFAHLLGV